VTGTASQSHAAIAKQVELIRQLLPDARRVATLWDPANAVSQQLMLSEALAAAARMHIVVRLFEVRTPEELGPAFAAMASEPPDAVLVLPDRLFTSNAAQIADLGLKHRLSVINGSRTLVEAGIVASYGPNADLVLRRAAAYVDKILR
jgi:putative ABC transport system substrate-binding protein